MASDVAGGLASGVGWPSDVAGGGGRVGNGGGEARLPGPAASGAREDSSGLSAAVEMGQGGFAWVGGRDTNPPSLEGESFVYLFDCLSRRGLHHLASQ